MRADKLHTIIPEDFNKTEDAIFYGHAEKYSLFFWIG
jgi:hypothetical protein